MCPFAYYKDANEHMAHIYCKLKDDKFCIYAKLCMKPDIQKFVPTDYMDECYLMNEHLKRQIPPNSYYVRFIRNNYLYVELDDNTVVKIENTLGDAVSNYVYLKKIQDKYFISLKPFRQKSKKNNKNE